MGSENCFLGRHSYALGPAHEQKQRVTLADFSAAPWQGFEKSERGSGNSSLFLPQAAVVVVALGCCLRSFTPPPCSSPDWQQKRTPPWGVKTVFLADIPTRWDPRTNKSNGLRLLIFLQPLGRALKNQNAAPTTPPCFCRWQRSSSLHRGFCCPACGGAVLFKS